MWSLSCARRRPGRPMPMWWPERRDSTQGAILRTWLSNRVLPAFESRVLPVDGPVAVCCAGLHVPDPRSDRDALIAATGIVHAMSIVTRNVADFQPTGVKVINPWAPAD